MSVPAPRPNLRPVPPEPPPGLRVIDTDGVIVGHYTQVVSDLEDVISGKERALRAEHLRFENLRRDKAAEAREHALFPTVTDVFDYWRRTCKHPNSAFTPERFFLMLPFVENPKYGVEVCRRAIDGAAFDPFCTTRKNGSIKRHDGIGLIFRDAEKFEEFVNRAPRQGADGQPARADDEAPGAGKSDANRTDDPEGRPAGWTADGQGSFVGPEGARQSNCRSPATGSATVRPLQNPDPAQPTGSADE